jgi:hypothetical protein
MRFKRGAGRGLFQQVSDTEKIVEVLPGQFFMRTDGFKQQRAVKRFFDNKVFHLALKYVRKHSLQT